MQVNGNGAFLYAVVDTSPASLPTVSKCTFATCPPAARVFTTEIEALTEARRITAEQIERLEARFDYLGQCIVALSGDK